MKVLILLTMSFSLNCYSLTADEIAKKFIDRDDGFSSYTQTTMFSCPFEMKSGKRKCSTSPRRKTIEGVSKDLSKNGKDTIGLNIVISPASESGMVFMQKSFDEPTKDDEQFIYLPSLKKLKRIVSEEGSGPKTGSLFGSEFAYEDMERLDFEDATYKLMGEEDIKGRSTYVIESRPTAKRKSKTSYQRSKVWVDKEHFYIHKVEMYDTTTALIKTLFFRKYKEVKNIWSANVMLMVNHKNKRMSMFKVNKQVINIDVDKSLFSDRAVKDSAYRNQKLKPIQDMVN